MLALPRWTFQIKSWPSCPGMRMWRCCQIYKTTPAITFCFFADYRAVKCIHTTEDTGGIPRCVSISEPNRSCSNQYRIQNAGGLDDLFGGLAGSLVVPHVKCFRKMMLYSQWDVRCAHFMVNIRKAQTESAGDRNEPVFRLIGHNLSPSDTHLSRAVAILYICAMYACTLVVVVVRTLPLIRATSGYI